MNTSYYLTLLDITTNKTFKKYFDTPQQFRRRLRYSRKLLVKEEQKWI